MNNDTRWACLVAFCVTFAAVAAWCAPLQYRPGREFRTVNTDLYEVSIQKNGRTDVTLAPGEPVFENACPMVWLDGEKEPEPLIVDGRWTGRMDVNDLLGKGQGLMFRKKNCEWYIHAYPTKPYLTVYAAFVNRTKKPVKVKMLSPWSVGAPKKGAFSLGLGTTQAALLDNGSLTNVQARLKKPLGDKCLSLWHMAAYNPVSQRSLIAGFLTNDTGYTQIRLERGPKAPEGAFDLFRAECVYDPPVEVPPEGRLQSEVLFLSIGDVDPLKGLEGFGAAVAAFNKLEPTRRALPHGWDSWATEYHTDINEERMLAELDFVDKHLKRYGWTHFSLDDGWQLAKGVWEADPAKFPHGMKWFADQVHARGMTAGIWTDPFTVPADAPLAKEHPEWLVGPGGLGHTILGKDERILDITAPGAYDYVKNLYAKIGNEWGYDALVETDFVYHLMLAESYADATLTRVQVLRKGMNAIRQGFGSDKFIMAVPPLCVTGYVADGVRTGIDCAPIWQKAPDKWPWGCVDTLANAAHRYYLAPHLWAPDQDCAYFGHPGARERWHVADAPELTWDQSIAWLTGAALTGGAVKIGDRFTDLTPKQVDALSRILPVSRRPARPIDLFERENPCIWSLPIHSRVGEWNVVALFNWDAAASQNLGLSFAALGLNPNAHYTVYDFWQDTYYGLARENLNVSIAPGSVRLLGLRRYQKRPMFLATDRHFTQGATDFTALEWDAAARRLTGAFDGIADTDYNLRILVPEPYKPGVVSVSIEDADASLDGEVLKISFHCAEQTPVEWRVQF